jgi:LL-diaminopimelate aminotransferase
MSTLVECVPNFSEGRDQSKVDVIIDAMKVDGVYLLDKEMDADHNRCVITLAGEREAIQEAAIAALIGPQDCVEKMRKIYKERRNLLYAGLLQYGWQVIRPEATFYLWAKTPEGYTSSQTVSKLLDEAGIVCTPGNGMGPSGEGYIRFALTVDAVRVTEAVKRISKIKW